MSSSGISSLTKYLIMVCIALPSSLKGGYIMDILVFGVAIICYVSITVVVMIVLSHFNSFGKEIRDNVKKALSCGKSTE